MTEELRQRANALHKQIEDLQARINIILDMRDSGNVLSLFDSEIGTVQIPAEHVLKYDILDIAEHALTKELLNIQEEYKKL